MPLQGVYSREIIREVIRNRLPIWEPQRGGLPGARFSWHHRPESVHGEILAVWLDRALNSTPQSTTFLENDDGAVTENGLQGGAIASHKLDDGMLPVIRRLECESDDTVGILRGRPRRILRTLRIGWSSRADEGDHTNRGCNYFGDRPGAARMKQQRVRQE